MAQVQWGRRFVVQMGGGCRTLTVEMDIRGMVLGVAYCAVRLMVGDGSVVT